MPTSKHSWEAPQQSNHSPADVPSPSAEQPASSRLWAHLGHCRDVQSVANIVQQQLGYAVREAKATLVMWENPGFVLVVDADTSDAPRGVRNQLGRSARIERDGLLACLFSEPTVGPRATLTSAQSGLSIVYTSDIKELPAGERKLLVSSIPTRIPHSDTDASGGSNPDSVVIVGVPLAARGRAIGALLITVRQRETAAAREFVGAACDSVAHALDTSLLVMRATTRGDRLASATDIGRQLATAASGDELLHHLASGLHFRLGYARAAIYELTPTRGDADTYVRAHLVSESGSHSFDEHGESANVERLDPSSRLGRSLHLGYDRRDAAQQRAQHTSWAIPMHVRGGKNARMYALVVEHDDDSISGFDEHDRALVASLADQGAGTLALLDACEELECAYISTVQGLVAALEASDPYTQQHSTEVASWAVETAVELGLSDDEIRDIELGAILHDIGKIAIPKEILNKPGKLTDEEFEVMKTHTIVGERIIAPIDFLMHICPIVRHEHERWDGHGYPDGIAAEDIPLGSRIILVCDAYHAITSDRPYREAQPHETGRRVLEENAGTQFDPAVVEAFIAVVERRRRKAGFVDMPANVALLDAQRATEPLPTSAGSNDPDSLDLAA